MDPEQERAAVRAAWNRGNRALEAGDWEAYSDFWAHADYAQVIHPHRREWLHGWHELGPAYRDLLAEGPAIRTRTREMDIRVSPSGEMAWATVEADLSFGSQGEAGEITVWQTVVFEKIAGAWKLVHGHVSQPADGGD